MISLSSEREKGLGDFARRPRDCLTRRRSGQTWSREPQTEAEQGTLRTSIQRGRPFGSLAWQKRTAKRVHLEFTFPPRGRPRET